MGGTKHFIRASLDGDVANAEHQRRVLYYENDEKTALEVKLMPLPGGWDSMPAERAISGHFIYQPPHYAARAERHQAHIQWQEEKQAKITGLQIGRAHV